MLPTTNAYIAFLFVVDLRIKDHQRIKSEINEERNPSPLHSCMHYVLYFYIYTNNGFNTDIIIDFEYHSQNINCINSGIACIVLKNHENQLVLEYIYILVIIGVKTYKHWKESYVNYNIKDALEIGKSEEIALEITCIEKADEIAHVC